MLMKTSKIDLILGDGSGRYNGNLDNDDDNDGTQDTNDTEQ